MQWLVPNKSGSKRDNQTGTRVLGAQDSWIHMGSECYTVQSHRRATVAQSNAAT